MSEITFSAAIAKALADELEADPNVILFGEDIAHHGGMFQVTKGLRDRFGDERVMDTPISESAFVGMALGAALSGLRPVVELMFVDFSLVAMDQLLNQIAKTTYMSGGLSVPLTIRTQGGGYKGAAAQHSQMLEALFIHVPGLKVVTAATPSDAYHLLRAAIADPNPVIFIEHKQLYPTIGPILEDTNPMEAKVVRHGLHCTVFSYSYTLSQCLEAASLLEKEGIDCEVIDLRWLNPLDLETVGTSVKKTHRAVIAHEAHARCGIGADLVAQIQDRWFDELDAPIHRVCAADVPIPFAKNLEDTVLPNVDKIVAAVREAMR